MAQAPGLSVEGNSPRSTVIPSPERMTSGEPSMNGNTSEGSAGGGGKLDPSREANTDEGANVNPKYNEQDGVMPEQKDPKEPGSPPESHMYGHLTPHPPAVGYPPYPSQVTPASPSPGANAVFTDAYGAAFLRPGSAGAFIPHTNPFGGHPSPLSPPRPTSAAAANLAASGGGGGGVPPNSPLFPRLGGGQSNLHPNGFDRVMPQPPSPTLAYTTPGGTYQTYGASTGPGSLNQSGSTEELTPGGWMGDG